VQLKSDFVYQEILARIEEGFWKPGQQIFSERQLSDLFAVSRVTVKHAISQLVGDGNLEYIKGKSGTFVAEKHGKEDAARGAFIGIALDNYTPAFASFLLEGIHEALWEKGYHTMYCNTHYGDAQIIEKVSSFIQDGAKGLIFSPLLNETSRNINDKVFSLARAANIPVIQVDRYESGHESSRVQCDNYEAMYQLSCRLLDAGIRTPLVLKGIATSSTEERLLGIRDAFAKKNIQVIEWVIDEAMYFSSEKISILQADGTPLPTIDAVIGLSQTLSLAANQFVKERAIPAITGGISASEKEVVNDFSAIQPFFFIGFDAGSLMIRHIENSEMPYTSIFLKAKPWPDKEN
jgi:DNA-binding LacI/PurR family transcriptional regulator